jgi:hypothetical protein
MPMPRRRIPILIVAVFPSRSPRYSLTDRGGDHGVLALGHVRQGVAHPMNSAPLPCRTEHPGDGVAQAIVSVGNHQLDALETTLDQALEESRPERFGFGRAETQADDLAPALGRDRHGDYCGDRDDAAAVADLEVGRVEPEIRPLAVDRAVAESVDPFINVPAFAGAGSCRAWRLGSWRCRTAPSPGPVRRPAGSTRRRSRPPGSP